MYTHTFVWLFGLGNVVFSFGVLQAMRLSSMFVKTLLAAPNRLPDCRFCEVRGRDTSLGQLLLYVLAASVLHVSPCGQHVLPPAAAGRCPLAAAPALLGLPAASLPGAPCGSPLLTNMTNIS